MHTVPHHSGFVAPTASARPLSLSAFTTTSRCALPPASSSSFLATSPLPVSAPAQHSRANDVITMKKGRVPRPMMPQRPQQQKTPLPEDGTPIFALYVRTARTKIWYPLGAVKGDDKSKNMVDALKGGFAKAMYQQALDRGMAQTLYGKENGKYVQGAIRLYPQLKKYVSELQFGYKVAAVGLDEQPTKVVTKEMAGSLLSNMQRGVSDFFNNIKGNITGENKAEEATKTKKK